MPLFDKAFYLTLFFVIGVGAAGFALPFWLSLIIAAAVGLFFFSFGLKRVVLFSLICLTGYFYYHLCLVLRLPDIPFNEEHTYLGLVIDEPEYSLQHTLLNLQLQKPHRGTLRVYLPPTDVIRYGDIVSLKGIVKESDSRGVYAVSFPEDILILEKGRGNRIKEVLFSIKNKLIDSLKAVLPPEKAALMSGLLFGERAEFPPALEEAMRLSGTTHIVALSGYNIAILVTSLSSGLAYVCNRRKAFWLSLAAIPAFVVMTGAEASVVRAGLMGFIMLLAVHQERIYSFRNAITLSAAAMLVYDPKLLSEDVGFQLSFAALLGIVYVYPWLTIKLKWKGGGFLNWKTNALQTLSAQTAVLPIILGTFGFVSPTAPISNILILELIPLTMFVGFLTSLAGLFSYHLSAFIGWGANLLLGYETLVVRFFAFGRL